MSKALTDGKIKIGVFMLPGRKRPCLCIEENNRVDVYGYFNTEGGGNDFVDRLGKMVNAEMNDHVEEVCKGCRHFHPWGMARQCRHPMGLNACGENDFCSHWERKEGD